ncbi:type IV pilin protein [Amphibiibacter pelophylacis]|uniref:Type IV pilin protein n=1 Tax=Amphibiibacter pelophylacis TaxID=1799477 RepID=A0ACC6NYP9_9BURK
MNRIHRYAARGFSLIEMMIVLAIIAILAAIVYPSYTSYMVKTRRAEAAGILQEAAMAIERQYGQTRDYSKITLPTDLAKSPKSGDTFYTVTLATPDSRTYTLTATPTTRQPDAECGNLILDQDGNRTVSGSRPAAECWGS